MQLERRLAELERRIAPDNEVDTIVWSVIDPQRPDAEMIVVTADHGECWTRQPGETEAQLLERAEREVTRNARGLAQLIADCEISRQAEVSHARA